VLILVHFEFDWSRLGFTCWPAGFNICGLLWREAENAAQKNLKLDSFEMATTYWRGTRGTWALCYWILIFRHFRKGIIPIRKARWERKGTFGLCKRRVKDELF
jgi:hypothetical protein